MGWANENIASNGQDIPRENWYNKSWNPKGKETQNSKKASWTPALGNLANVNRLPTTDGTGSRGGTGHRSEPT